MGVRRARWSVPTSEILVTKMLPGKIKKNVYMNIFVQISSPTDLSLTIHIFTDILVTRI